MFDLIMKYVHLIESQLYKLTKTKAFYRFCCPICREGNSWGIKRRGYIIFNRSKNEINYYCHNCDSKSIENLFKFLDPTIHKQYLNDLNKFRFSNLHETLSEKKSTLDLYKDDKVSNLDLVIKKTSDFQFQNIHNNSMVYMYLKQRYIYEQYISTMLLQQSYSDIVIPYYYKDLNSVIGYQTRSIDVVGNSSKYIITTNDFKNNDYLFHNFFYNVNFNETVYVTEGFFDGSFLKNFISLSSVRRAFSFLKKLEEIYPVDLIKKRLVFVLDNDEDGKNVSIQLVKKGYKIFISPLRYKDINEIVIKEYNNITNDDIMYNNIKLLVDENTSNSEMSILKLKLN